MSTKVGPSFVLYYQSAVIPGEKKKIMTLDERIKEIINEYQKKYGKPPVVALINDSVSIEDVRRAQKNGLGVLGLTLKIDPDLLPDHFGLGESDLL